MDANTRSNILAMSWQEAPVNGGLPSSTALAQLPSAVFAPVAPVVYTSSQQTPPSALEVRGLIPYTAFLMSGWDRTVDPSSVEIVETCGRVYLCKLQIIDHPDPVLPIVGLAWWQGDAMQSDTQRRGWGWLRRSYSTAASALSRWGRSDYRDFKRDMAQSVNFLLSFFDRAPKTHVSLEEYAFTARHLTGAMRHPAQYR